MSTKTYINLQELIDAAGAGYMPAPVDFDDASVPEGYIEFVPPAQKDPALYELKYTMHGAEPEFFYVLKCVPHLRSLLIQRLSVKAQEVLTKGVSSEAVRLDCTEFSLRKAEALCTITTGNIYYKNGTNVLKVNAELFRAYTDVMKMYAQNVLSILKAFSADVEFAWSPEHALSLYESAVVTLRDIEKK